MDRSFKSRACAATSILLTLPLLSTTAVADRGLAQTPVSERSAVALRQQLDRVVPALLDRADIVGASVAVIRDGQLFWTGAYGLQDAESGQPATGRTVFQAASLSKPVFALAVLRLAERDLLDLDAPLADQLPYPRLEHDARYHHITARMVLSHSSGLPNWGGERLELQFDPGARFSYSGEGYVYLQKVVEGLTGKTLDEIAEQEVFGPLEMSNSSFVWRRDFQGRAAAGHDELGRSKGVQKYETGNAAYSLLTTAEDYARFLIGLLAEVQAQDSTVRQAFTRQVVLSERDEVGARGRLYWGLGWGLQFGRGGTALWHWGHNDGFRAYAILYPDRRTGLVYLSNSDNGLAIAEDLLENLFDDERWALDWLGYEQHDEPAYQVRRELERTFLSAGREPGLNRYRSLRSRFPDVVDERFTNRLGYFLLGENKPYAAIDIFELNAKNYPSSANVWDSLGEGYLTAAEYTRAMSSYERSLELDPENENAEHHLDWISEALVALRDPIHVSAETLARYAGGYGPRQVALCGDALYYRRAGRERHRLIPMSDDTFMLSGSGTFRLRFVAGESGPARKTVGLYADGSRDESARETQRSTLNCTDRP